MSSTENPKPTPPKPVQNVQNPAPVEVKQYIEIKERMSQMRLHYQAEKKRMQDMLKSLEPTVSHFLSNQINNEFQVNTNIDEVNRWGVPGKLCQRIHRAPQTLSREILHQLITDFLHKVGPSIGLNTNMNLADLLTDFIWVSRLKKERRTIVRTYSKKHADKKRHT